MDPLVPEFGMARIWFGGLAQAVGLPIAWLRVRRTEAWRNRPRDVRRVDLLADFIRAPVELTIIWTFLLVIVLGTALLLDWATLAVFAAILLVAGPLLLVPVMVLGLDLGEFERRVEKLNGP